MCHRGVFRSLLGDQLLSRCDPMLPDSRAIQIGENKCNLTRVPRTPQNKLQTVTNVLFNDATVDPAWTQVKNI